jgi:hypothetical protein
MDLAILTITDAGPWWPPADHAPTCKASRTITVPPRADLRGGAGSGSAVDDRWSPPGRPSCGTPAGTSPAAMIGLVGRPRAAMLTSSRSDLEHGTNL